LVKDKEDRIIYTIENGKKKMKENGMWVYTMKKEGHEPFIQSYDS